jgi:Flp pilus assembly protein TadD
LAQQPAEPDPFTKAAMEKRRDAEATLASAMARIGTDRTDVAALIDAGRASLALDNPQAALGFLTRAGQLRADDGQIVALTGAAMVQMERPAEAMELFSSADRLGAPERLYLADRALAQDLLGRQDAAQRDYEAALTQTNDPEVIRRYALSLGISGQVDRAVQVLTPQLRAQDRAAWRTRAMIYAMAGRQAEAQEIVKATMPPALATNIVPFLARLPGLTPPQQAAAAHFGALPGGNKPGLPAPQPPRPKPVVVAAAPAPSPAPPPTVVRPQVATPTPTAASTASPTTARPVLTAAVPARPTPTRAPAPAPTSARTRADLAAVMATLEIPAAELAATEGALDAAALERIKEEQRAAALAANEARKKEVAAARAKAEADAAAKAEADKKRANPARIWVQVATGANAAALGGDFGRLARKYPDAFQGRKGATAEWGRTRRLVTGPFASSKAANDWLAALKQAGGDGFVWTSDAGEEVTPVR